MESKNSSLYLLLRVGGSQRKSIGIDEEGKGRLENLSKLNERVVQRRAYGD